MTNFNSSGMVFFPGNSSFSITMEERWTKFKVIDRPLIQESKQKQWNVKKRKPRLKISELRYNNKGECKFYMAKQSKPNTYLSSV